MIKKSLKNKILVIIALVWVSVGFITAILIMSVSKEDMYNIKRNFIQELNREQASKILTQLITDRTISRDIAKNSQIIRFALGENVNITDTINIYREVHTFDKLYIFDSEGKPLYAPAEESLPEIIFSSLKAEEQTILYKEESDFENYYVQPIYSNVDKSFLGNIVLSTSSVEIVNIISGGSLGANTLVTIIDDTGNIIYRNSTKDPHDHYKEIQEHIKSSESYFTFYNEKTNEMISGSRLGNFNYYVISDNSANDILENITQRTIQLTGVVAVLFMGSIFVIYLFLNEIFKPLEQINLYLKKISIGEIDAKIGINSGDELERFALEIKKSNQKIKELYSNMEATVKAKTSELSNKVEELQKTRISLMNVLHDLSIEKDLSSRRAKDLEKFSMAVEYAGDHIVITDSNGIVVYANKAVEKITGYTRKEIIGKTAALWGKQMSLEFYKDFWYKIKTLKQEYIGEINNIRKTGEKYIASIHVTPILDSLGKVIFFVEIERDITKAREIDKMKTEFISLASHQLRTPLTAIKWYLEMLISEEAGKLSDQQRNFINQVNDSNERMIDLVTGLLNVSRIESGRLMIEPVPSDIKEIINVVLNDLKQQINERKTNIIVSANIDIPKVNLDPKMIRQVLLNLMSNAIKYSRDSGQVIVMVSKTNKELVVQIADNGLGIPAKDKDRVFTKFYRGENVIPIETEGNGLGLYLVKTIIDSSGGKIWYDSEINKVTTFWFTLPLEGMSPKKGEVRLDS